MKLYAIRYVFPDDQSFYLRFVDDADLRAAWETGPDAAEKASWFDNFRDLLQAVTTLHDRGFMRGQRGSYQIVAKIEVLAPQTQIVVLA